MQTKLMAVYWASIIIFLIAVLILYIPEWLGYGRLNAGMNTLVKLGFWHNLPQQENLYLVRQGQKHLQQAKLALPHSISVSERLALSQAITGQVNYTHANSSAAQMIRYGNTAFDNKDFLTAEYWYQLATQIAPQHAEAWYRLGRLYYAQNQPHAEIKAYEEAVKKADATRDMWYNLGLAYEKIEGWTAAIQAYSQGLTSQGDFLGQSNLHFRIAFIRQNHLTPPDIEGAWQAYQQALTLDNFTAGPESKVNTLRYQGLLLAEQKQWSAAIEKYNEALEIQPDNYWVRLALADALWQTKQQTQAEETLLEAITLLPDNKMAYRQLGDYYRQQGNIAQAKQQYLKVLELDPSSSGVKKVLEELESSKK